MQERTEELTRLNAALARAKGEADDANISKTKFLAAASHDILQPLNAARLYVTSLIERQGGGEDAPAGRQYRRLARGRGGNLRRAARHVAARHRRDAAGIRQLPHRRPDAADRARIRAAGRRARDSTSPSCRCSLVVRSDRRLLRRLMQNLVSNAIKYTPAGRVLVGCRRRGEALRIDVYDTGIGIPESQAARHFRRIPPARSGRQDRARARASACRSSSAWRACSAARSRSISTVGRGSHFSVEVPLSNAVPIELPQRDEIARRSGPARRHHGAVHRQRARGARRHGDAAARLGLRGDQGARSRPRAGRDRGEPGHAERPAGRLPSRRRQRHRGDRRVAPRAAAPTCRRS